MTTIKTYDDSYIDALQEAVAQRPGSRLVRVRTKRVRTFAFPEKVTGKSGDRIFGAERKRTRTNGHRTVREFVFA